MEDYNTGTLPHRKYYDLAAHEKKRALQAQGDGSDEVIARPCSCSPPGCFVCCTCGEEGCLLSNLVWQMQDMEKAVFNDEAEVAAARKREELVAQQERLREAYNELKYTAPDKVEAMRDQEMTRMKMSLAYRTGDASCLLKFEASSSHNFPSCKCPACYLDCKACPA